MSLADLRVLTRVAAFHGRRGADWLRFFWSREGLVWVTLPALALTLLHYALPAAHTFHLLHDTLRRLYHVPIVAAGVLAGLGPAMVTAFAVSVAYVPHVVHRWGDIPTQRWDAVFEIVLFHLIGALTGGLADALRRQRDAVLRADRLKTLGTLAAGMAHEVCNPLTAVRGAAQRLGRTDLGGPERMLLLDIVGKETARLEGIVRNFLSFGRPAPLVRTPTDLCELARDTLALVESEARARAVAVRLEATGLGPVDADGGRIKQALLNLVLNAVQAAPEGSDVTVSVRPSWRGAVLAVRDHGPGLPDEVRRNLFAPFATGRANGTGLGLAVARQIAEAHGGTLDLHEAAGGGTVALLCIRAGGSP